MGVVYRAHDTALGRRVALKAIVSATAARRDRFLGEARAVARLRHPAIVAVHEIGEDDGRSFLVMDLIDGESLDRVLARGALDRDGVLRVVAEIARALDHAHDHGIVHRDVKPQNILIDREGGAHLTDFGVAFDANQERHTVTGQLLGTPSYASPEQLAGDRGSVGRATDVWALGVLLYEGLSARLPFEGERLAEIIARVFRATPTPLRTIDPSIPVDLARVVERCLERRPADRYATAAELAEDLARVRGGEPIARRARSSAVARLVRARSGRAVALVVASVMAVAAIVLVAIGGTGDSETAHSTEELRAAATDLVDAAWRLRRDGVSAETLGGDHLPRLEALLARALERDSAAAWPHYLLGRALLLVGRDELAARSFDRAIAAAPTHREALFERVVLSVDRCIRVHDAAIDEAFRAIGAELAAGGTLEWSSLPQESRVVEDSVSEERRLERRAIRSRIDADLAGLASLTEGEPGWETRLACLRALALLCPPGEQPDLAADQLEAVLRADPELHAARRGLARILRDRWDWAALHALSNDGLAIDRGYLPFIVDRGSAGVEMARDEEEPERGRLLDAARVDADLAVALAPDQAAPRQLRARVHDLEAARAALVGRDPAPHYAAAIADLGHAIGIEASAELYQLRGIIQDGLAEASESPDRRERRLAAALDDLARAIELAPTDQTGYLFRANAWLRLVDSKRSRGEWPEDELRSAAADLDVAVRLDPSFELAWGRRGRARGELAILVARDPTRLGEAADLVAKSAADYGHALSVALDDESRLNWLAGRSALLARWGTRHAAQAGEDPSETVRGAIDDLEAIVANERADRRELWRTHRDLGKMVAVLAGRVEDGDRDPAAGLALWERALEANREGLAVIDELLASSDPTSRHLGELARRDAAATLHYNAACALARIARRGGARRALREEAFLALEQAIDDGLSNGAMLRADVDLIDLHDDPRWASIVARVEGGGE